MILLGNSCIDCPAVSGVRCCNVDFAVLAFKVANAAAIIAWWLPGLRLAAAAILARVPWLAGVLLLLLLLAGAVCAGQACPALCAVAGEVWHLAWQGSGSSSSKDIRNIGQARNDSLAVIDDVDTATAVHAT
jgi:hypothetical protein